MPRLPVDGKKVIEHRISLGTYERERLDTITAGWTFGRVMDPIVGLVSNPYAIASTVGLLEALGVLNIRGWIKDNTPLDEWYNALSNGLFASYDAAIAALDELGDLLGQLKDIDPEEIGKGVAAGLIPGDKGMFVGITYRLLSLVAWAKTRGGSLAELIEEAGTDAVGQMSAGALYRGRMGGGL